MVSYATRGWSAWNAILHQGNDRWKYRAIVDGLLAGKPNSFNVNLSFFWNREMWPGLGNCRFAAVHKIAAVI
jgi:hypothetical protein